MRFNTGREYSDQGQRIAVKVMDTKICPVFDSEQTLIMLIDRDRGLDGLMEVYKVDETTIMKSYDNHGWASPHRLETLWKIDGPAIFAAKAEFHKEIIEEEIAEHPRQSQEDDFSPGM